MGVRLLIMVTYIVTSVAAYSNEQALDKISEIDASKIVKRKDKDCNSVVELLGCDMAHPLSFNRREENRFRAKYTPDEKCDIERIMFDWIIYFDIEASKENYTQLNDYTYKNIFIIKPYTIGSGSHGVNVYVKEVHRDATVTTAISDACIFTIRPELPIPQITGGSEVTANSREAYKVNGKESIDVNVAPGQKGHLQFKWTCTVSGVVTTFCEGDLGRGTSITIPASQAKEGSTYTITLSVKTSETDWQSTKQVVHFENHVVALEIRCLKNCPPVAQRTNHQEFVILQAVCTKSCKKVSKNLYEWSIDIPGFDYDANTKHGRKTDVLYINENVLEMGKKYKVSVALEGMAGGSSIEIDVHVPPTLGPCSISPTSGIALTTQFTVDCQYPPGEYTFEIFSIQNDIDVIVDQGIKLENMIFSLGPGSKVKVKIIDNFRFSAEVMIPVTVTSFLLTTGSDEDTEKEIMSKYFDVSSKFSMEKLMQTKDFENVLQVANSVIDEMEKILKSGNQGIAKKYYSKVLHVLSQIPMDTVMQGRQLGALVTKITDAFSSKPDPEIAALGTKICKISAEKMLQWLQSKRFPDSFSEDTTDGSSTLCKCSQASVASNFDVLEPDIEAPVISTPFPLLDIPAVFEDYPDYVDDQNISKAMNEFDESSNNLIKVCYACSKILAVEMSTQEETKYIQQKFFTLTSTLKIGSDLIKTTIKSEKVALVPSEDFAKYKTAVHAAMCISTRNIFWWMQREIFSSISIINFSVNGKSISHFDKPFVVSFGTQSNITSTIEIHEHTTPKTPSDRVPDVEYDFERISMHRIHANSSQSFVVEFHNLDENTLLDVVVSDFHKPNFNEFREKSVQIGVSYSKLFISNDRDYDSWYYLAVFPCAKMSSGSVNYKFSVYTLSCFRWTEQEAMWEFACESTSDSSTSLIKCKCYHSSALTAMLVNNEIRTEETLVEELVLETQACYIILASVVGVYFLYCVFFIWFSASTVKKVEQSVYFLADVPSVYRYGYVLIVKTGNKSGAGTTSNVSIKIHGTKSESEEHVLNYPDPEKNFLQKNGEDWFFVGTKSYLGDIEKIDLWFDSIGYRPAWFCTEIEVFDIQGNKYWLFQINKWFEILKNEQIVHTALPEEPNSVGKKRASSVWKKFLNSFRGPHMWNLLSNEEQAITRMTRLHIIFSIFLTTYAMGLYFYGCPKLENSDSLSYTLDYGIDKYVVLITVACFVLTFVIHFPIVWFFRYNRSENLSKTRKILKKAPISTNFLCWLFLIINIIVSMSVLIILGFWVPHVTGLLWLTSVLISLLVYIFIMENVMRMIVNLAINQRTRVQTIFEEIKSSLVIVERQRAMLYKNFGAVILRPFLKHLYKPDQVKIKEQKYWASIKERLWEIMEDLIMITIYVTLLYLVILMDRDKMTYSSHTEVKEMISGVHSRTLLLEEASHRKELQDYVKETLVPSMQSLQWYGKYVTNNPGMTIDNANKYLGIARLRQHRTYNVPCAPDVVNKSSCHPPYSWHAESKNFSESWLIDKLSNRFARMDPVWNYFGDWYTGSEKYVGLFAVYPGGGYVATLGRTMQNSITNLNYLFRNHWIDRLSRNVFVEFLLYNPNNNLFNSVRIMFEISASGYTNRELQVHTAKLLFVKEEIGVIVWIILLSFVVMLVILILKLTLRLIRKGKLVLKDIWHLVDIVIIVMNLVCLGLYAARSKVISRFLSQVETAKHNEFVNYFHLMYMERILTIMAAILVFLATFRLWKLMRFMMIIKVVEKTLLLSAPPLICLFLYQLIFVLACGFFGILKYGDHSYDFRGIFSTISNLFLISLNLYDDFDFNVLRKGIGSIYYSIYMLVTLGIYTIYIAIITISYADAAFYYSDEEEYNVVNYVNEQCEYYIELFKIKWRNFRLRGGNEKDLLNRKVYPKADEFRYAKCHTLPSSRMEGMASATKCIVRSMNRKRKPSLTDGDAELIKETIVNLFRKESDDKEIFFISNVEGKKLKFVDDRVMLRIENLVEAFLSRDDERSEREKHRKLYKKIIESHEQKMRDIGDNLTVLLNALNVVNINV